MTILLGQAALEFLIDRRQQGLGAAQFIAAVKRSCIEPHRGSQPTVRSGEFYLRHGNTGLNDHDIKAVISKAFHNDFQLFRCVLLIHFVLPPKSCVLIPAKGMTRHNFEVGLAIWTQELGHGVDIFLGVVETGHQRHADGYIRAGLKSSPEVAQDGPRSLCLSAACAQQNPCASCRTKRGPPTR